MESFDRENGAHPVAEKTDVKTVASALVELGLRVPKKPLTEVGYPNLALCVIDAVFTTQGRFGTAQDAVRNLQVFWEAKGAKPRVTAQRLTLSDFVGTVGQMSDKQLTTKVFGDSRMASGAPDRPRARVAVDLARNLSESGIERKQDLSDPEKVVAFAAAVKATRGFGQAGASHLRALATEPAITEAACRFVSDALGRTASADEARELLGAATKRLAKKTPGLSAVDVDQLVWQQASGFSKVPTTA